MTDATDVTQNDPVPADETPPLVPRDETIGEGQPRPTEADEP